MCTHVIEHPHSRAGGLSVAGGGRGQCSPKVQGLQSHYNLHKTSHGLFICNFLEIEKTKTNQQPTATQWRLQ